MCPSHASALWRVGVYSWRREPDTGAVAYGVLVENARANRSSTARDPSCHCPPHFAERLPPSQEHAHARRPATGKPSRRAGRGHVAKMASVRQAGSDNYRPVSRRAATSTGRMLWAIGPVGRCRCEQRDGEWSSRGLRHQVALPNGALHASRPDALLPFST